MTQTANSAVRFTDVSFAYPGGPDVLSHVTLGIAPGERVALVGPNGAGKSTLLRHVVGLLHPREGTVRVCGTEVTPAVRRDVRRRVGSVFPDPADQLFCPTVAEDVAFGPLHLGWPEAELDGQVARALEAVGLTADADRPPHHLSDGQKRRAAIATVLSYDPDILALDEPSANLDPRGRRRLIELLSGLGRTLLIATHDLDLAWTLCERTVLLRAGRVVADGPTRGVLADRVLLEANGMELPLRLQSPDAR